MKIRFTSVAITGVGEKISEATVLIEKVVGEMFSDLFFGAEIKQFTSVMIAVGDEGNRRFSKKHEKIGSYKSRVTGETTNFISCSLPLDPEQLLGKTRDEIITIFCDALKVRLISPPANLPDEFDYEGFSCRMVEALDVACGKLIG